MIKRRADIMVRELAQQFTAVLILAPDSAARPHWRSIFSKVNILTSKSGLINRYS
jgi:hypothetical protein